MKYLTDQGFYSRLCILLCFPMFLLIRLTYGVAFTMINKCDYTLWPGILPNSGSPGLGTTGFELPSGGSRSFQPSPGWSGRVWARTGCTFDANTGQGICTTGDCGTGQIECNGAGANPPATLAEFTLGGPQPDYYDVSLVDGFNVPMIVEPTGGSGSCMITGCASDLNEQCPSELRVGDGDACRSACEAFGTPEYCCTGAFASPNACAPTLYSQMFKASCPRAYSYAFDDATSTFTCVGADYTITFCPTFSSQRKSSRDIEAVYGFGFRPGSGSSGSRHSPKFSIGGGQMLTNFSSPTLLVNHSKFAWLLIILIVSSTALQLFL